MDLHDLAMEDVRSAYELKKAWDEGNTSRPYGTYGQKKAYGYFERAYRFEKTVRSTHNFGSFLFFDYEEEIERSLEIQQECLALRPRSFLPHYQYGRMLFTQNSYGEAIPRLTAALTRNHYIET